MKGAHNFVINHAVMNDIHSPGNCEAPHPASCLFALNIFALVMSALLKETIPGAAFDSSDRDPPARCHPGTRLSIINRTQHFIINRNGNKRMRWIVGPAGVGKSAIMQTLAETKLPTSANVVLGASIFFSIYGRSDGTKAIITLAYQLAVNHDSYREFIEEEITRDPSLLHKSMAAQFDKFIVEPFIWRLRNAHRVRYLILVDGLDECDSHHVQRDLLSLISSLCIKYPASPLIWVVASRPEPHITSFLSRAEITRAYEKEEIEVDSNEAREDVERFLQKELTKIQKDSPTLKDLPRWPSDHDFLKIAFASRGLFAYASTVLRFIDDPKYGNPVSLLREVLEVIHFGAKRAARGKSHPMIQLDSLYSRILSKVPTDVMLDTRKLLLMMMDDFWADNRFVHVCNWLGMTKDAAYGATHHLRSVLNIPELDKAGVDALSSFHKSFIDYLADFDRSGFCSNINSEIGQLNSSCVCRILEEAPNGTYDVSFL